MPVRGLFQNIQAQRAHAAPTFERGSKTKRGVRLRSATWWRLDTEAGSVKERYGPFAFDQVEAILEDEQKSSSRPKVVLEDQVGVPGAFAFLRGLLNGLCKVQSGHAISRFHVHPEPNIKASIKSLEALYIQASYHMDEVKVLGLERQILVD